MTASSRPSQQCERTDSGLPGLEGLSVLVTGGPHSRPQSSHCNNLQRPVSWCPQSQEHRARLSHRPSPTQVEHLTALPSGVTHGPARRAHALAHIPSPWQPRPGWEAAPDRGAGPRALRPGSRWGARGSAPAWHQAWGPHTAGSTRGRRHPRRQPLRCSVPPSAAAASKPPQLQPGPPPPPPGRRRAGQEGLGLSPQAAPTGQGRDGEGRAEAGAEAAATGASAAQP